MHSKTKNHNRIQFFAGIAIRTVIYLTLEQLACVVPKLELAL